MLMKINNEEVNIMIDDDFVQQVDKCMGPEAAEYYVEKATDIGLQLRAAQIRRNSDLESYEAELEDHRRMLSDFADSIEYLKLCLKKPRVDKQKAISILDEMLKEVNEIR